MDEVDGLCDRVAIMIDGELQCLVLAHLQEKFAQGFTVTVKTHVEYKGDEEYRAKLLRAIRETFPDSLLQQSYEPRPGTPQTTQGTRFAALPKLQIPNFSGDRRDWQGFWDQFESSIHSNATLPRIEKFKYLVSYLTGPAKDAIEGIRLADDNYDFAVKIITNRFGRKDLLVDDHLDKLLALEPVQNSADTDKLRVLYDTVTFRINALEGLGVSPDQYSVVLHRVLLWTLPHDLGLLYRQRLKEAQQDAFEVSASPSARSKEIKVILDFLRAQVEIREESASDCSVPSTHRVQERGPRSQAQRVTGDP
ncbi:uncharacterized protein LOC144161520 [Haemaphysalis longicornis]